MPHIPYYGTYATFYTPDKTTGQMLMGSNNLIGDTYEVEFRIEGGDQIPWLHNRFNEVIGYVVGSEAQQLVLCHARGWNIKVILASVFFAEQPSPGMYWGEIVAICFPPSDADVFETFTQGICALLAQGNRPAVDLGQSGYQQVLSSKGSWMPTARQERMSLPKNNAVVKDHRSVTDTMIEKARSRNPGCIAAGIAFDILIVVLLFLLIKSLLGF